MWLKIIKSVFLCQVLLLSLSACKKRYTCSCTSTLSSGSAQEDYKSKIEVMSEKMTMEQAQAVCDHEEENINRTHTNVATNNGTRNAAFTAYTVCKLE